MEVERRDVIRNYPLCEHNLRKGGCKKCGGDAVCDHGRLKIICKKCGWDTVCEHNILKSQCNHCCMIILQNINR